MELIFVGIIGLLAGLLVNYLSDQLPQELGLTQPTCQHCQKPLSWGNYLSLGACAQCGKPRSVRTFLTLAAGSGLSLWIWLSPPAKLGYWLGLLVLIYFGVVVIIDAEHHYILTLVSLVGAALGLVTGLVRYGLGTTLLGGAVGLGVMLAFYGAGILFARYRAKKRGGDDGEEALGLGDVYLATVLGLMLGWPGILAGLLFGILAGGLISFLLIMVLVATKRYESMTVFIAYGPYLIFGAFILLYVPQILTFLSGK